MVSYDIVIGNSKLFSINPQKNNLKKRMLRYIGQDYLSKRESSLPNIAPYNLTKKKLWERNSHFGKESQSKVSWEDTVDIFTNTIEDIGNMTLGEIHREVTLKDNLPFPKTNVFEPIKDLTDDVIIRLLGKGEQTEEGEKWINTKLSPDEVKTYLDEVWEKIGGSPDKMTYSFNDTKIKVDKLTKLNVSQLRGRKYSTKKDPKDDTKLSNTLKIPSKMIPKNYWAKRNIKNLRGIEVYNFNDMYGNINSTNIGSIITTNEEKVLEYIKLKKAKIELDSFEGYPAIAVIADEKPLSTNIEISINDNLISLNEFKPLDKNGFYVLWLSEKPYDSDRWKAGSDTDDKRREIHVTLKSGREDTKEEILKATILMAIRELITNMKVTYEYNIKVNHINDPSPITIKYKPLKDITVTEFKARSKLGKDPSQDYGQPINFEGSPYKGKSILNPKASNTDALLAQRLLQHFYYNYNTLNNTIKKLKPQESN